MNLNLSNKNALVAGSSQGIGLAVAKELALMGANITLVARNEDRLKSALGELSNNNQQSHKIIVADFNNPEQLSEKVRTYLTGNDQFHILVNNSGGPPGGPIVQAKLDEFHIAFQRHLACNHILTTLLLDGMKSYGYGRIINIISTSVKQPLNGLGVSNTIRGAVANWAKTVANEVGSFGITVNNVLPGATKTGRLSSIIETKAKKTGKSIEELEQIMLSIIPANRFADSAEIANAVAFLASPAASYINGINLPVDGGRTASL